MYFQAPCKACRSVCSLPFGAPTDLFDFAFQVPNDPSRPDSQPLGSDDGSASVVSQSKSGQQRSVATTVAVESNGAAAATARGGHSVGASISTVCPTIQVSHDDPCAQQSKMLCKALAPHETGCSYQACSATRTHAQTDAHMHRQSKSWRLTNAAHSMILGCMRNIHYHALVLTFLLKSRLAEHRHMFMLHLLRPQFLPEMPIH